MRKITMRDLQRVTAAGLKQPLLIVKREPGRDAPVGLIVPHRGESITLAEAAAEANRGTLKQRVARHRKRLKAKYGHGRKPCA